MAQTQWDITLRSAKSLETRLETSIQKYAGIAQKINADYLCDEENALLESKEEQEIASLIENDLKKLSEAIDIMRTIRNSNNSKTSQNQDSLIRRYYDIHQEFRNEYRNTYSSIKQKRDSADLLQHNSNRNNRDSDQNSLMAKLMKEKGSLHSSMRSINEVISQAFETKNSLLAQRGTLQSSTGGLTGLVANVPSFQKLIDGVQKKKTRETMIVATFIGILLCFTIWWLFLR